MNPDFLILSATLPEVSYFLDMYPPERKQVTRTGCTLFSGTAEATGFDLLVTGPGVFNTAHALSAYLEHYEPRLIIDTGVAGVFVQAGGSIGDIGFAVQDRYIHAGVRTERICNGPLPFDLVAGNFVTRQGLYEFDGVMVEKCRKILCSDPETGKNSVLFGGFVTVCAITSSCEQAQEIYNAFSPVMEAMEGAAAAHVAMLYNIPVIEVRAGSNFTGERAGEKWDIRLAAERVARACAALCRESAGLI